MKIENNGGSNEFIANLIAKSEPSIGQIHAKFDGEQSNWKTKLAVRMEVPTHGGASCSGDTYIYPVYYTGSMNFNGGIIKNYTLPFHVTETAMKTWKAYVDGLAEKLAEYIRTA